MIPKGSKGSKGRCLFLDMDVTYWKVVKNPWLTGICNRQNYAKLSMITTTAKLRCRSWSSKYSCGYHIPTSGDSRTSCPLVVLVLADRDLQNGPWWSSLKLALWGPNIIIFISQMVTMILYIWLVVESQLNGKIKNVPNHHSDIHCGNQGALTQMLHVCCFPQIADTTHGATG
jgi:hypothetical protein